LGVYLAALPVAGWLADRIGRINGLLFGSFFALVGGALQASLQSSNFMLIARVVTGIGTGGEHTMLQGLLR
jgi:MFS family permease